jgi:hypothetical protein
MKKNIAVAGFALCLGVLLLGGGAVARADQCLQNCADDLQICLSRASGNAPASVCDNPYHKCAVQCPDVSAKEVEAVKEGVLANFQPPAK